MTIMIKLKVGDKALMEVNVINVGTDGAYYTVEYPYDYHVDVVRYNIPVEHIHAFVNENDIKQNAYAEYHNLLIEVSGYSNATLEELFGTNDVYYIMNMNSYEDILSAINKKNKLDIGDVIIKTGDSVYKEFIITKKINETTYCAISSDGETLSITNANFNIRTFCENGRVYTFKKIAIGRNIKEFLNI